ncbi:hypothetical protein [Catenulispora yoronensis]|uniref:hypothetical protein n=1 Tax=Catenulispora yoronensis TaxID=450799 RepID=UPI0031CF87CB
MKIKKAAEDQAPLVTALQSSTLATRAHLSGLLDRLAQGVAGAVGPAARSADVSGIQVHVGRTTLYASPTAAGTVEFVHTIDQPVDVTFLYDSATPLQVPARSLLLFESPYGYRLDTADAAEATILTGRIAAVPDSGGAQ